MITRLNHYLGGGSHLTGLLIAHAAAGVLQGVALGLLLPFLRAFFSGGPGAGLWLAAIAVTAGASAFLSAAAMVRSYKIGSDDVSGGLIRAVGEKVQRLPLGWFDATSTGRVAAATSTDIHTISHLPSIVLPQIASVTGSAAAIAVIALWQEPRMGAAMIITLPLCVWALRWLRRAVVAEYLQGEASTRRLAARVLEFSHLQPILRATGSCQNGWAPLEHDLREDEETAGRAMRASGPASMSFHTFVEAGMVLAIGIGTMLLLGGRLDPAVFVALALMAVRFADPVGMLAFYVAPIHEASAALDSIGSILDTPTMPEPDEEHAQAPAAPFDVVFDHVCFGYAPDQEVIHDVSLTLPAGSVTALVGPSGSGKSTLSRLAARFWDVDTGSVAVGGADVRRTRVETLMEHISLVFQDVYLFDTTIAENVRIGRPGASWEQVRWAAERAGLTEVVDRLPQGWETCVGEGGSALSGGERQRVAIARAFLKDAPVLLLDEVTSALDGANEAAVTQALEELSEGRTVLVIAHRLSTIRHADRIVVLVDGDIEAIGTHAQLHAAGGTYRRFWDDQTAVDRWRLVGADINEDRAAPGE
ncbi:ABC transporter ATP-binding protein [Actinomyces sp. MRS3W]|uniref:ABC transporter ATP-binding protein n=1 Tax=Actinomyces sp. MRS3W TaxID=2800796 RepID=UPI0028FDAF79|nr:ABC transporter ATP-binding protein [Actinomyces sp. MRS3W]MDU0349170.1 ABC transporter ATP-binding protein [Actinomyces sp. MRS3W]